MIIQIAIGDWYIYEVSLILQGMAQTILVTGAEGQLGKEISRLAVALPNPEVRFIFTNLKAGDGVQALDITDEEAVGVLLRKEKVTAVVNCAAYTEVEKAECNPETADLLNHVAVAGIAEAAREVGATLIHISTDYVFSGEACVPYREMDETGPTGVYGVTKLAGERAVIDSGCKYIIIRTAWLYSPHGKNFLKTMLKLTSEKKALGVVCDQVGTPTSATDLAALIIKIICEDMTSREGIYHFSGEGVCSWYDFAVEIAALAGNTECEIRPCRSEEYPSKVRRPHYSVLDKKLVKDTFGVKIQHWRVSLADCIERIISLPGASQGLPQCPRR